MGFCLYIAYEKYIIYINKCVFLGTISNLCIH